MSVRKPGGHALHEVAFERSANVPGRHEAQAEEEFDDEKLPGWQIEQEVLELFEVDPAGHGRHELDWEEVEKVPASQAAHDWTLAALAYVPLLQALHCVEPAGAAEPGGQVVHTLKVGSSVKVPSGQGVQVRVLEAKN